MLKQASVSDLISERVTNEKDWVFITMRRYPRFVNKRLRDEYLSCLSPQRELFEDWISAKRRHHDHDGAFRRARFEERFDLEDEGFEQLERLCKLATKEDVYLVCQCHPGLRCHREMVLILAKKLFKAKAEAPKNEYAVFEKRIPEFRKKLKLAQQRARAPVEKKKKR